MKYYDKNIYELENRIKTFILILAIFIIGFLVGYWTKNKNYEAELYKQKIEIVDLKEQIHILQKTSKN